MRKISDRFLLGAISGMISSAAGRAMTNEAHRRGLFSRRYNPQAAALFVPRRKIHTAGANLTGLAVNNIGTAGFGIATTYMLSATGTDMAALKGAGLAGLFWIMIEGLTATQFLKLRPKGPASPLIGLAAHLLAGALCAELIVHLGDERLFPPRPRLTGRIPLVYTGYRRRDSSCR